MSSLRERRRKRTADTICRAAIDLALEHGLDNVTTDMISEAAGISPRTFFNYFPYKEAVFAPPPLEFQQDELEKFVNSKQPIADDMVALFIAELDDFSTDREYMLKLHGIAADNPKLMTLRMAAFHEYETQFAQLLKMRLGSKDDDPTPNQIAAVVMAIVRVGFENWVEFGNTTPIIDVPKQLKNIPHIFDGL